MKILFFILCYFFTIAAIQAQSLHFSQFEMFPVATNPALTGNMNADYRLAAIHRQQWKSLNTLFQTSGVSIEKSFKNFLLSENSLGIGITFMNDDQGENLINEQHLGLSSAYHYTFGKNNRARISLGIQALMKQTQVDYSSLQFASQYEYFTFNPELSSGEPVSNEKYINFFLNAGGTFSYRFSTQTKLITGISVFNLLKPQNSAFGLTEKTITGGMFHSTIEYKFGRRFILYPQLQVLYQGGSYNPVAGTEIGYHILPANDLMVLIGAAYRNRDALIFKGGVQWSNIKIKGAYDMTTSQLNNAREAIGTGKGLNAFEVALIWEGWSNKASKNPVAVPCEIF